VIVGKVADVSAGGCYVETTALLPLAPLTLTFMASEGPIQVEGTVVRVDPGRGIGIKFNEKGSNDRGRIRDILNFVEQTIGSDSSAQRYLALLTSVEPT
jgi:hypothetical protein